MKRYTNLTSALIVLNYMKGKERKAHELHGKSHIDCEHMNDEDVAYYVAAGKISVEDIQVEDKTPPAPPASFILPENPTAENLNPLPVKDLRRYCKENILEVPKGTKEDGVIEIILASLAPQE